MTGTQQLTVVLAVGACGVVVGEGIRRWLLLLTYRRSADTNPPPGSRWWVPPVLAAVFAGLTWRVVVEPPATLSSQTAEPWIGHSLLAHVVVLVTLLGVFSVCTASAAIDLDVHRLPDELTGSALAIVVTGWALLAVLAGAGWPLARALACGVAFGVFYLVLAVLSSKPGSPGVGLGDIKLSVVLGVAVGWLGLPIALVGLYAGIGVGAVVALAIGRGGATSRSRRFAYGPSLVLGAVIAVLIS